VGTAFVIEVNVDKFGPATCRLGSGAIPTSIVGEIFALMDGAGRAYRTRSAPSTILCVLNATHTVHSPVTGCAFVQMKFESKSSTETTKQREYRF
jgi:hypothetical protein